MNSAASRPQPPIWTFWLACGLAAAGGAAPIVLAGTSGRVSGVIVPLLVAAAAYAGCGLLQSQGKMVVTILYLVAGLATLYGLLALVSVPLRVAVIGTCPPSPALCAAGLEQPLTAAENAGIGFAAGLGIVALLMGYFGLTTLYRRLNAGLPPKPWGSRVLPFTATRTPDPAPSPPVRRSPPVVHAPAPEPEAVTAVHESPSPSPDAEVQESEGAAAETRAELAAPEPQLELPSPAPELELPAHMEAPPLETAAEPVPEAKPGKRRASRKGPNTPGTTAT
ncbi:MAG: hypothetical protein ACXWMN_05085 [Candidatus Limnocylindria bacterium]